MHNVQRDNFRGLKILRYGTTRMKQDYSNDVHVAASRQLQLISFELMNLTTQA